MKLTGRWKGRVYESTNFIWGEVTYDEARPESYRWRATLFHNRDTYSQHPNEAAAKRAVTGMLRELITDLQEVHK